METRKTRRKTRTTTRGRRDDSREGNNGETRNDDDDYQVRGEEKGRRGQRHTTRLQPHEQLLMGWIAGGITATVMIPQRS